MDVIVWLVSIVSIAFGLFSFAAVLAMIPHVMAGPDPDDDDMPVRRARH